MERGAWTEERLDDLATGMREGFARVDNDIRELRQATLRIGAALIGAMSIGFLSVLVAILGRGA